MFKFFKKYKFLTIIIILAAVLRLWNLSNIPPGLMSDEAALGYNAYSILHTGRDEYGQKLPLVFKSFGDWKPGLYIYADVPFVALLGLNEFSTRLPGALSGIIAIWLIYLVVFELFKNTDFFKKNNPLLLPLLSAFFLAINPWHIQFSRGAWEAGVSLTLTLSGIYFFLRSMRDKPNWFVCSIFFFSMTLLTYQGAKLSTGIVVAILLFLWRRKILSLPKKSILFAALIGLIISMPILISILTGKAGRLEVFSVLSYPRPSEIVEQIIRDGSETRNSLTYYLFHSESLNFARGIIGRWTNVFSPRFLFFEGDWNNLTLSTPSAGVILFLDIIFLVSGLVVLAKMGKKPTALFIAIWLIFSPLPSALTRDNVNAVRSLNLVVPLTILLALGASFIWMKLKEAKLKKQWVAFLLLAFSIIYLCNFTYWIDQYFIHKPFHFAKSLQYGYKETIREISKVQNNYKHIVFVQSYDQPYIFFLFYTRYDPSAYQSKAQLVAGHNPIDVGFVEKLDNIGFEQIDWPSHRGRKGVLFVGNTEQIPPSDSKDPNQFKLINEIKYPNGQTAFRLVEVRQ